LIDEGLTDKLLPRTSIPTQCIAMAGAFIKETVPWLMDECRVKELWLPNHPVMRSLLEAAEAEFKSWNLVRARSCWCLEGKERKAGGCDACTRKHSD